MQKTKSSRVSDGLLECRTVTFKEATRAFWRWKTSKEMGNASCRFSQTFLTVYNRSTIAYRRTWYLSGAETGNSKSGKYLMSGGKNGSIKQSKIRKWRDETLCEWRRNSNEQNLFETFNAMKSKITYIMPGRLGTLPVRFIFNKRDLNLINFFSASFLGCVQVSNLR